MLELTQIYQRHIKHGGGSEGEYDGYDLASGFAQLEVWPYSNNTVKVL